MSLNFEIIGESDLPLLFCVHGLLGGPENFRAMVEKWSGRYCIIIVDLHSHMRSGGLIQISEDSLSNLTYDGAAEQIIGFLDERFPGRSCYFAGLSLGGKISYEFAGRAPERFSGAVITDVGPGTLTDSSLYCFISRTVPSLNMNQPWPALKEELVQKIPDRNIRVMLQTQIHYPVKDGPAVWRAGMSGLKELLDQQSIADQWGAIQSFASYRRKHPEARWKRFVVFKASSLSAVSDVQLAQMRDFTFIEIRPVTGTSHFVHVTHREEIESAVLSMLETGGEANGYVTTAY